MIATLGAISNIKQFLYSTGFISDFSRLFLTSAKEKDM